MKNYSHNCIARFPGLLCVNHGIDFMQIITFCCVLAVEGWDGEGEAAERKSKRREKETPVALTALASEPSSWVACTRLIQRWMQHLPPPFLKGGFRDTRQGKSFILLFWAGIELLEEEEERRIVAIPWG